MSALQQYVERKSASCSPFCWSLANHFAFALEQVLVVTQDGRVIVGKLRGSDAVGSIILAEAVERIFSPDEGVEQVPLGLYIMRGDSM